MVRKSVMFNNVIVNIAFRRRSFVFSQSSREVSASLTDVGGVAVGAIDLIYCFLSVPRFVVITETVIINSKFSTDPFVKEVVIIIVELTERKVSN